MSDMYFGKKLKEIRLKHADMGLRKFSKEIGIKASDLSNIECGYAPYPNDEIFEKMHCVCKADIDLAFFLVFLDDWSELVILRKQPFIMQKMEEGIIFHATKRIQPVEESYTSEEDDYNTRPATGKECIEITEFINNHVREHNKKADEYNNGQQRKIETTDGI